MRRWQIAIGRRRCRAQSGEHVQAARDVAGDPITFVVPEDRIMILSPQAPAQENCVTASIVGEEFVGSTLRLYADAGSQQEIRLLTSYDARLGENTRTQSVALSWKTADAYALPE